jgi:two-component system, cell cycle sensor histidine kinase and response regulator CckA
VLADASQIQQVVINLWSNACHAVQGRAGRITVSLADLEVDAAMAAEHPDLRPGPHVRLTVRDNGCGMDPEVRAQIFEPFFTTKPEGHGTGLGLSVVHSIAIGHQGTVVAESWPGKGTAMHLYLPADSDREDRGTAHFTSGATLPMGSGEQVMLVDDHALVQDATRSLLEQLGYRVDVFGDPLQALSEFRSRGEEFRSGADRSCPCVR